MKRTFLIGAHSSNPVRIEAKCKDWPEVGDQLEIENVTGLFEIRELKPEGPDEIIVVMPVPNN